MISSGPGRNGIENGRNGRENGVDQGVMQTSAMVTIGTGALGVEDFEREDSAAIKSRMSAGPGSVAASSAAMASETSAGLTEDM